MQVKTGVQSFYSSYFKYLNVINEGYQVFFQKVEYTDQQELKENYYKLWFLKKKDYINTMKKENETNKYPKVI